MCSVVEVVCCIAVCGSVYRVFCNTASAATHFVGEVRNIKYCVCDKRIALPVILFAQCDISIHA